MKDNFWSYAIVWIGGTFLGGIIGMIIQGKSVDTNWHARLVKNGYAHWEVAADGGTTFVFHEAEVKGEAK